MQTTLAILVCLVLAGTATCRRDLKPIRLPSERRIRVPSDGRVGYYFNCEAWRLAVEVHNLRNWKVVPAECVSYVSKYMVPGDDENDSQYYEDVYVVVAAMLDYLESLPPPANNSKDTWLFDLTDTLISDIGYYSQPDINFGGSLFNRTKYNEWYVNAELPEVPYIIEVVESAKKKGFQVVILSGTSEEFRNVTIEKLEKAGFADLWDLLILKDKPSMPSKDFKASSRAQLKKDGYKVIGNVGDQYKEEKLQCICFWFAVCMNTHTYGRKLDTFGQNKNALILITFAITMISIYTH